MSLNEWEVVGVIVVLVGLVAVLVKPMISLTKSITELTVKMTDVSEDLSDISIKNSEAHNKLWAKNAEQDSKLIEHDVEIKLLKQRGKNE